MNTVYLGFGSNLGDRGRYISDALSLLKESGLILIKQSSLVETDPLEGKEQPKYLNMVAKFETDLGAHDLLGLCQKIENQLGRVRSEKWASRTIDIDILIYNKERINLPDLIIPHPGIANREFVKKALIECGFVIDKIQ